nr:M23 family metallopeptidase [uncultured Oscillibacter sp.]
MSQEVKNAERTEEHGGRRRGAKAPEPRPARKNRAAIAAWEERETQTPPRRRRMTREAAERDLSPLEMWYRGMLRRIRRTRRRWRQIVREERKHNFPESERVPIQVLLFIWNMLPMLGSLLREHTWGRRKQALHAVERLWARLGRHKLHPAVFMGTCCALAAVILFCSTYTMGTTVTYDGEVIAAVSSQSAAEEARANLEKVTARTLGESFTIDDSLIQYSSGLLKRQDLVDGETFEETLSEEIGLVTSAYCLYVDGERIGATPYEGALEELLAQIQSAATNEDTISCEFAENVEIKQEFVPSEDIMNLGYLAETLYSTKTAEVTYEVKKGDTWSEIAEAHGLTNKELLALNPGYNIDKLQIGEVLTLSASVPYLTMTVVQRERYVEDVMYDIQYTDSDSMYQGDTKVTSKGQYGAADVVATVTYVNGEETERTVLSSVTLREPVTEQQLRGTKVRPTWYPTGTFRWPTTGRITSRFGNRSSPGGIGSTNHKGIDIANSYGTPIYAADGGTVVYAGWMSGYGYLVQIDHGGGRVTYYGHNSSLTVSVGQHVYKGQQIARMGSTGNSTGNHCHFEVRVNGVAKNPLNYLP